LHSPDKFAGTGMGLAICKRIIENHDGIIRATSAPNQGASFDIYIPSFRVSA
jgi:signal transduction histidine kinase